MRRCGPSVVQNGDAGGQEGTVVPVGNGQDAQDHDKNGHGSPQRQRAVGLVEQVLSHFNHLGRNPYSRSQPDPSRGHAVRLRQVDRSKERGGHMVDRELIVEEVG